MTMNSEKQRGSVPAEPASGPATRQLTAIETPHAPARRHYFGWLGLALGIVALGLALLPNWLAPLYDPAPKPMQQRATDWLTELKDKAAATIRMENAPPPADLRNPWRSPRIAAASLVTAFATLVFGILAFVRHEDPRMVACTVALGAGTICAYHLMTAVVIMAFALLVGVVLARHG
jgi:hypothetical protein